MLSSVVRLERQKNVKLRQPYKNEGIRDFSYENIDVHEAKMSICNMWKIRDKVMKEEYNKSSVNVIT